MMDATGHCPNLSAPQRRSLPSGPSSDPESYAGDLSAEHLYEHAPCGFLSAALDGSIDRVNATFLRWTGYRREDLVGAKRFQDLLSVGSRIYHRDALCAVAADAGQRSRDRRRHHDRRSAAPADAGELRAGRADEQGSRSWCTRRCSTRANARPTNAN